MKLVSQLLDRKGHAVFSVSPNDSVFDAIRLMSDKGVGALMVLELDKLVGVISERDYARQVILKGRSSKDTPVRDIMTTKVVRAEPSTSIEGCLSLMTEMRIRHLPIMDGDRLLGIVSIGDLVKAIITDQRITIEQLEQYIKS